MAINEVVSRSHILHRALDRRPLNVVSGEGISFTLDSGRDIIDAASGPSVACLGHNQPEVTKAILDHLNNNIAYAYSGSFFTNDASEVLASLLLAHRPGGLSKAIFVNSGSEATDAALKLAVQYWHEKGEKTRSHFIARKQSYHGNTIGALCVSGHDSRREFYKDFMSRNVSFVDPCYAYRLKESNETDEQYAQRLAQQVEDEILRVGPDNVAGFIAETVSGTTLGCLPAVPGYFAKIREICDKYGVLLILDEIMCGMGKTGTMHAWQQEEGFRGPDIQTIGKALGGGFVPLSGVLLHEKIFEALSNGSKVLAHGHTFQAHPLACAAAVAVQKIVKRDNLLDNVKKQGKLLERLLNEKIAPLPLVGNVRGRGLFWAVEFVRDKERRLPFSPEDKFCESIVDKALELGLAILGNLGRTGEHYVDLTILSPPYIVQSDEIYRIVDLLAQAIGYASTKFLGAADTVVVVQSSL